jgi:hypothetical protein
MSMFPDRLRQLLAETGLGLAPENVRALASLCDEWFAAEPICAVFTLRALFHELVDLLDGDQGVRTEYLAPFVERLLPRLRQVASILPCSDSKPLVDALNCLVQAFQECRVATATIAPH